MKLAEALNLRADLQKRIAQLEMRLRMNAKVQEGETTAENPYDLLQELQENIIQLEILIKQINFTNGLLLENGASLMEMLAERDMLALKNKVMRNFLENASEIVNRYSKTEIKIKPSVDVRKIQTEVDVIAKKLRELDSKIQSLNWTVEVVENK